ncbi:MAG TPA: DUF6174 domain-containing protein [Longimicrobium sp.]|nr:DUF6174 domain-containing protein [Longimicrobium sp.]
MIQRIRPFALVLTLAAAACAGGDYLVVVDPQPVAGVAGDAPQQRGVWDAQDIDDYRFAYSRVCFCPQRSTVQVTVRDGRVTDVRQVNNGRPVPRENWVEFLTVDALFDAIAEAQARSEYTALKFHPTLGYPVEAEIGTLANDAGVRHLLSGLEPID